MKQHQPDPARGNICRVCGVHVITTTSHVIYVRDGRVLSAPPSCEWSASGAVFRRGTR